MEIVYKKVDEIIPYENNPRDNDEVVEYVANSIKEFGFKVPIVISSDNVIAAGHTRVKAAKLLGMDEVPCIVADDLTDEQIKAFRLADNKVGEPSEWDDDKLKEELDDILNIDMEAFGFDLTEDIEDVKVTEPEPEVKFSEELLEEHNYVVLYFDNTVDWLQAQTVLGIEPKMSLDSKPGRKRIGVGRVINGAPIIERLAECEN